MANDTLHFRLATTNDAPQIRQLVQFAFRAEDGRPGWGVDPNISSSFRLEVEHVISQIIKPDGDILIASDSKGVPIASIEVSKRSAGVGRLSMLAVDEYHQHGGVGRQVLAYAEDYCRRTWGVKKLGLNALSTRHGLILWYTRNGYQKTGELTPIAGKWVSGKAVPDEWCLVEFEKDLN